MLWRSGALGICVAWSLVLTATGAELTRFERAEVHMGTEFHVALYAADQAAADQAFEAAFKRIDELNQSLSDYLAESELSRLGASAPHEDWVSVSPDLWYMLSESQRLSRLSDGAFDVTVGPLSRLWRRARRRREPPPARLLDEARQSVGHRFIELDHEHQKVRLTRAGMRLDLGAIAKGYAAQQALETLRGLGIDRALVEGGGDMALAGPPPGEEGWRIAIAQLEADEPPTRFVQVAHRGLATSGDFWQFLEIDGQRYSHILDPRTGYGVTHRSSVTVIAPTGEQADALASTLSVLEPSAGLALLSHYPGAVALIVVERDGQIEEHASPGFTEYLVE